VQLPKPRTDLPERVVGVQPIRPWRGLGQGLAGQERQAFATLLIEAAGSRGAVEAAEPAYAGLEPQARLVGLKESHRE
jgi:hypothetical protein